EHIGVDRYLMIELSGIQTIRTIRKISLLWLRSLIDASLDESSEAEGLSFRWFFVASPMSQQEAVGHATDKDDKRRVLRVCETTI
ncbi:hypothetical protein DBV15_08276, partial [Temnothorax longispinosus]